MSSFPLLYRPAVATLAALLLCACAAHRPPQERSFNPPELTQPPADGAIFHTGYSSGLFENSVARNIGDTVTVVLAEQTTAQKSSQTDTAKTTKDALAAPNVLGFPMTIHGTPEIGRASCRERV